MMIEPTETESRETLDAFADAMIRIAADIEQQPETVRITPNHSHWPSGRSQGRTRTKVEVGKKVVFSMFCIRAGSILQIEPEILN